jgi:hypothetical protein
MSWWKSTLSVQRLNRRKCRARVAQAVGLILVNEIDAEDAMESTTRHGHSDLSCCRECDARSIRTSRLVAYSLIGHERRRTEHLRQFEMSLFSLRAANAAVPVVLFAHGALAPEIAELCHRFGVMVADQGSYYLRLAALSPRGAGALASFPLVHKGLNFSELAAADFNQVLCCDLDTLFLGDVDVLFDRYGGPDVVAREEVHSGRSVHGADSTFIDEALLAHIARHVGRTFIPPFNTGVVLYNNRIVRRLATVMPTFVDDVWRLLCGLTIDGFPNAGTADESVFEWMPAVRRDADRLDLARALPVPSNNAWIVEEIAWWLALGSVPGLTYADFLPTDVAQTNEFAMAAPERSSWTVCHYFSRNLAALSAWLYQSALARAG